MSDVNVNHIFSLWFQCIQQDYTSLLSSLIRAFSKHPEFHHLVQLTDYHDPEMDFFENMKHIQVIRNVVTDPPKVAYKLSDSDCMTTDITYFLFSVDKKYLQSWL